MTLYGINIDIQNKPKLDPDFIPVKLFNEAFLLGAAKPVSIAVERADGQMATVHTKIYGTAEMKEADCYYVNRLVKTILWMKGGFKIYVSGDDEIYEYLKSAYSKGGIQDFDFEFMGSVFEHEFIVEKVEI